MSVGKRIKAMLDKEDRNQAWLSRALGVTKMAVTHWVKDKAEPDLDTLRSIAKVLGGSLTDLVGSTTDSLSALPFVDTSSSTAEETQQTPMPLSQQNIDMLLDALRKAPNPMRAVKKAMSDIMEQHEEQHLQNKSSRKAARQ